MARAVLNTFNRYLAAEYNTAVNRAAMFRFNPGKAGKVFPPKHPYYKAPAEVKKKVNAIVMTMVVKSQSATERDSYLSQMESLYGKKVIVNGNGHDMKVGFRKYGNKHLYNDTFRSSILTKGDLIDVDQLLASAKFITKAKFISQGKMTSNAFIITKPNYMGILFTYKWPKKILWEREIDINIDATCIQ